MVEAIATGFTREGSASLISPYENMVCFDGVFYHQIAVSTNLCGLVNKLIDTNFQMFFFVPLTPDYGKGQHNGDQSSADKEDNIFPVLFHIVYVITICYQNQPESRPNLCYPSEVPQCLPDRQRTSLRISQLSEGPCFSF